MLTFTINRWPQLACLFQATKMSACNGYAVSVSEKRSFFCDIAVKYPEITSDGKIDTREFLEASKSIVKMFDFFGRGMATVKYDVNGNIEKLEKKYNTDPERFRMLNDMIRSEVDDDRSAKHAVEALLWLKRALEYTRVILKCLVDDHKSGRKTENLVPFCSLAYEQTLKRYHGWVVQKLCALSMRGVPWRRDFLRSLAYDRDGMEEVVIIDMEEFLATLDINVDVIIKMYDDWGLNSDKTI